MASPRSRPTSVLIDKLGERLAFERTAVRLYEALRVKLEASDHRDQQLTPELLEDMRNDELRLD